MTRLDTNTIPEAARIHINWTRYTRRDLSRNFCPTCDKRTFFVAFFQDWYGWASTCLRCGDRWQDGEFCERPFMRGWRKKSIEAAKKTFRRFQGHEQTGSDNVQEHD